MFWKIRVSGGYLFFGPCYYVTAQTNTRTRMLCTAQSAALRADGLWTQQAETVSTDAEAAVLVY